MQNIMYKTPTPMTSAFKYWKEGGSGPADGAGGVGVPSGVVTASRDGAQPAGPTASLLSFPLLSLPIFFHGGFPSRIAPVLSSLPHALEAAPARPCPQPCPAQERGEHCPPSVTRLSVCPSVRCALFSPSLSPPVPSVPSPRVSLPVQPQLGPFPSLLSVLIQLFTGWVVVLSICCRFYQPCKAFFRPMAHGHRFLSLRPTKSCSFRAVARTGCFAEHP